MNEDVAQGEHGAVEVAQELWQREAHELVVRVFRARVLLIPLLLFILAAFFWFDPVPWKLWLVGSTIVLVITAFLIEQARLRRNRANELTIHLNLLLAVLVQSLLIYVTGGIASPLLVIYVPICATAGLTLEQRWRAATVAAVPASVVFGLAVGTWGGFVSSSIPAFFQLGDPVSPGHGWLFTRTGVLLIVILLSTAIGVTVRTAFGRVVHGAIKTRQGALETLASRNHEILSTSITIAHELKNPLSSIQGLAQLMARGAEQGTKERERLDVMLREIGRMSTTLDEFRNFSRPLSGLSIIATSLSELVAGILVLNEGNAARKHISLRLDDAEDLVVQCDAQKLKQALVNLIQNAIEASPPGREVTIRTESLGDEVLVRVQDEGPGIGGDVREKLFTPGFTTKARGSGIGLVVARSVVEQHGGELLLENRAEGGCIASLRWPRQPSRAGELEP